MDPVLILWLIVVGCIVALMALVLRIVRGKVLTILFGPGRYETEPRKVGLLGLLILGQPICCAVSAYASLVAFRPVRPIPGIPGHGVPWYGNAAWVCFIPLPIVYFLLAGWYVLVLGRGMRLQEVEEDDIPF